MAGTAQSPMSNGVGIAGGAQHLSTDAILQALELVHNPSTDNDLRRQASEYLDQQRDAENAYQVGFSLALERSRAPLIRHFGLSLVENFIRRTWHDLGDGQTLEIRSLVLQLAQDIQDSDAIYLRNKVGQLWIELAKKSWALDWLDMDALLQGLWDKGVVHKELVLFILENLSDDTFAREDSAAAVRGQELNTALLQIFTPESVYGGGLPRASGPLSLRNGTEGWLSRVSQYVHACSPNPLAKTTLKVSLTRSIATMRSAFPWVMLPAVVSTQCLPAICSVLSVQDTDVLMAAIQGLHTLFDRSNFEAPEFQALVLPMYQSENVRLLQHLYEWSVVGVQDMDSPKYAISKKFSEMISFLADRIEERSVSLTKNTDFLPFFTFMSQIARHPSLLVSIPILHSWVKILSVRNRQESPAIALVVGELLDTTSQRTLRYEQLPEDSQEPALAYLSEDFESVPDRHAFVANYRKFCVHIIELVCSLQPHGALPYVFAQTDMILDSLAENEAGFDPSRYRKSSTTLLRVDAHLTVVDAASRGYSRWLASQGKHEAEGIVQNPFEAKLEEWATRLLARQNYRDPLIRQRIIKTAVEFSRGPLDQKQSFALKVLEHILSTQLPDAPQFPEYSEAIKDLHVFAASELRRLAYRHADYFASFYDLLEAKIREIESNHDLGEKAKADLPATLLIIVQRANNIDPAERQTRLFGLVNPIVNSWQTSELADGVASTESFASFMAFNKVMPFLQSQRAQEIQEWDKTPLSKDGITLRADITNRYSQLPLRVTRTVLAASVDKTEKESQPYEIACELWSPAIPIILPPLLQLIGHAQRLHNTSYWPNLAAEMQDLVPRILQDRFWQAGISEGSMHDFYHTIASTRASLEGFASAIRGTIRNILETSYSLLYSMSRLGRHFYANPDLPARLADSVFGHSAMLSAHSYSLLLAMGNHLIEDCPPPLRKQFLPPIVSTLFRSLDYKCKEEWESLDRRKASSINGDALGAEMRAESILRQLSFKAAMLVASLLDPLRDLQQPSVNQQPLYNQTQIDTNPPPSDSLRGLLLSDLSICEPLLLFCSHAMTFRDTRSSTIIVRTIRSIVPFFANPATASDHTATSIREFISSDMLKAAITSLHDGYFVELQKDLAALIGTIWVGYGTVMHVPATATAAAHDLAPLTATPRNILLSLPGVTAERVDATATKLALTGGFTGHHRQQRALVLGLLDGLRGVRISELGKFDRDEAAEKSRLREKYLRRDRMGMDGVEEGAKRVDIEGEGLDELGGVAGIFG